MRLDENGCVIDEGGTCHGLNISNKSERVKNLISDVIQDEKEF